MKNIIFATKNGSIPTGTYSISQNLDLSKKKTLGQSIFYIL